MLRVFKGFSWPSDGGHGAAHPPRRDHGRGGGPERALQGAAQRSPAPLLSPKAHPTTRHEPSRTNPAPAPGTTFSSPQKKKRPFGQCARSFARSSPRSRRCTGMLLAMMYPICTSSVIQPTSCPDRSHWCWSMQAGSGLIIFVYDDPHIIKKLLYFVFALTAR